MGSDPIKASLIKRRDLLLKFSNSFPALSHYKTVKITIDFQHKRFSDNTNRSVLELDSVEVQFLIMEFEEVINRQVIELGKRIEDYG